MNKKYLLLIIGLLLCVSVFLAYQVSQASPAIPNPGHGTSDLEGDASLNMNSNKIINLSTPTADTDAATKAYVDAAGSKTAFRFIVNDYNTCPTITGVTCRFMLRYQYSTGEAEYPYTCTQGCQWSPGCTCFYSSL